MQLCNRPAIAGASSRARSEAIGTRGRRILKACDPLPQCLCLCAVRLLRAHISSVPRAHVCLTFSGQLGPLLTLGAVGLADLISPSAIHSRDKSRGAGGRRALSNGGTGPQQQTGGQQQRARHWRTGAQPPQHHHPSPRRPAAGRGLNRQLSACTVAGHGRPRQR